LIDKYNRKRIKIFVIWAFGISWLTGLVIFLTGGLDNSPTYDLGGAQISLAYILLATAYMFGPAIANILTRLITHERFQALNLKPHFEQGKWKYFLIAWFLPGILTIAGSIMFFLLFPRFFDGQLNLLKDQLGSAGGNQQINPWMIVIVQILQALIISPLLNSIATFGEEFGWRGYLQPKLMPLGGRKAVLITGIIWGIWHWPVILMGYNYGNDYFGAPFLGPLAMVWFTLSLSVIFGWLTIKSSNVWPAVIAHGAINGIAAIGLIFVKGTPDSLLGPTPVGFIGGIGLTIIALILLIAPRALLPVVEETDLDNQRMT
jgi:membrane protease YdiL (CAAX protease family)